MDSAERNIASLFHIAFPCVARWKRTATKRAWAALVAGTLAFAANEPDSNFFRDVKIVRTQLMRAQAHDPGFRDLMAMGTNRALRAETVIHVYLAIRLEGWLCWKGLKGLSVTAGHHTTTVLHAVKVLQYLDVIGRFSRWKQTDRISCPEDPDKDARYRTNVYVAIPLDPPEPWPTRDAFTTEGICELTTEELDELERLEEAGEFAPVAAELIAPDVEQPAVEQRGAPGRQYLRVEPVRVAAASSAASPTEHNACLGEIHRHAVLAPLATEENATAITEAARIAGKLHLLAKAMREYAAKVAGRTEPLSLKKAVSFATGVREDGPVAFVPPVAPPDPAAVAEQKRRAAEQRARDAVAGERRVAEGRAASAAVGLVEVPPEGFALPAAARAALARRADAIDGPESGEKPA